MKKLPIYRVLKHTYYEKCDIEREHYTIQKKGKFLWWDKWVSIRESICGMGDCYDVPIKFDTESDAIYAIKNLQRGTIPDGWRRKVVLVFDNNK
jgi:hypothetical protein